MKAESLVHVYLKVAVGNRQRGWLDFKLDHYPTYQVDQELLVADTVTPGSMLVEIFRIKEINHSATTALAHEGSVASINLLVEVIDRKEEEYRESEDRETSFMLSLEEKEELFEIETLELS